MLCIVLLALIRVLAHAWNALLANFLGDLYCRLTADFANVVQPKVLDFLAIYDNNQLQLVVLHLFPTLAHS